MRLLSREYEMCSGGWARPRSPAYRSPRAGRRGRAPAPFGGLVKLLVSAAAVAALAWLAVPWVSIARRGTLDHCALEAHAP